MGDALIPSQCLFVAPLMLHECTIIIKLLTYSSFFLLRCQIFNPSLSAHVIVVCLSACLHHFSFGLSPICILWSIHRFPDHSFFMQTDFAAHTCYCTFQWNP